MPAPIHVLLQVAGGFRLREWTNAEMDDHPPFRAGRRYYTSRQRNNVLLALLQSSQCCAGYRLAA
jgi:hypothetical protein